MATVVLQAVGTAIGGAVGGPIGAAIGGAIGSAVGYSVDQAIFSKDQVVTGPRLDQARFLASTTGAPMPRVYGRARLGGQIIWATRFEEVTSTTERGGKGGGPSTKVKDFSYFANFAVGICEGEISCIRRIWADGKELDLTTLDYRVYHGGEDNEPDPLIEARQGFGNAPAHLGTAHVVFEGFPLATYGNRLPQISFEVVRSVNQLDKKVEAVSIIPGAGEYAYEPDEVSVSSRGELIATNRHNLMAVSDWAASIDELQAICPNLKRVSLIVSWFGTDLRASQCKIEPRTNPLTANKAEWRVAGLDRNSANPVSRIGEGDLAKPAFGGTPTDQSVVNAIRDLKARGLEVVLYPFIMMDVPAENTLANPYAETSGKPFQTAYPWRGEITCDRAIGEALTDDQTAGIDGQIAAFSGAAVPGDFAINAEDVTYSGVQDDWGFRRHILHYAKLAELAGGVSGFIIGSELRGLTRLRNADGDFPFVSILAELAVDVRAMLGETCQLTYASDWTEYFGYQPQDGSGDVWFNLDELWSNPAIDAIGIDNYMPLSDWREDGDPGNPGRGSAHDIEALSSNIAGGEGFDWYYASEADRETGNRSTITDGLGEPWVWRYKDLVSWWTNPHYNRPGGIPSSSATEFVPMSKPVWFTELGCPAVDKGANQPNLFPDTKGESSLPYFSSGKRDDLIQNRFLEAHYERWQGHSPDNPLSPVYGGPMVDPANILLWAWDARPFPVFPREPSIWADGDHHETGHWLNGRLGGCALGDLFSAILGDYAISGHKIRADGFLDGYVIASNVSPRAAIEPLVATHRLAASDADGDLSIKSAGYAGVTSLDPGLFAENADGNALPVLKRLEESELPFEMAINHFELYSGFEQTRTSSRQLSTGMKRVQSVDLPAIMPSGKAAQLADMMLQGQWVGRERASFNLGPLGAQLEPGDIFQFEGNEGPSDAQHNQGLLWQIDAIEKGANWLVEARRIELFPPEGHTNLDPMPRRGASIGSVSPFVHVLDLPVQHAQSSGGLHVAASARPWARNYSILSSPDQNGFRLRGEVTEPAWIGTLKTPLDSPGSGRIVGRWDHASVLEVEMPHAVLSSATSSQVLGGRNVIAVQFVDEKWELIQYRKAELVGPNLWHLSQLLRGQSGSEPEYALSHNTGTACVAINEAVQPVEMDAAEKGLELNWSVGPAKLPVGSEKRTVLAASFTDLASRPLAPCHLRTSQAENALHVDWIRRTRIDGDSWEDPEVPLGEEFEAYQVFVTDSGGSQLQQLETDTANVVLPLQGLSPEPVANDVIHISVAQIGTGQRLGPAVTRSQRITAVA